MTENDPNLIAQAERRADLSCPATEQIIRRLVAELVRTRAERDEARQVEGLRRAFGL